MPATLSVIIPTLNAAHSLPDTADALLEGVSSGLIKDLVISDGGSTDGTATVAEALGAQWVVGPAGRGAQLQRGVEAATGLWVLLLHADTQLAPGWSEVAHRHTVDRPSKAGWFRLKFRADGCAPRCVAAGANLRSRLFGLPYGDQGLLVSRHVLESVGGVPGLPLMEDVALAKGLRGKLVGLDAYALTSAERYRRDGWARRVASNLGTLVRYKFGADPTELKARYDRTRN